MAKIRKEEGSLIKGQFHGYAKPEHEESREGGIAPSCHDGCLFM